MAKKVGWNLNIETGIEVKQESFNKAAKIFEAFYDKYDDKKMTIDTSDLVKAVKQGVSEMKQLYNDGTKDSTAWLNIRPRMKEVFDGVQNDAADMFSNIKVLFSDGSYVGGLEDILKGFDNQLSVVFADVGGLYDGLLQKQQELMSNLKQVELYGGEDYDTYQLSERINLLNQLFDIQRQVSSINPTIQPESLAGGYKPNALQRQIKEHQEAIEEMERFGLIYTSQLERRREILSDIKNVDWNQYDQLDARQNQNYNEALDSLQYYIQRRYELIQTLEDEEEELFSYDGVEEYKNQLYSQINVLESYVKELENLRDGKETPVIGDVDLSGVVGQLEEIRDAILSIRDAFEPLTTALSSGNSALHKIVTANIEDLNVLENKLTEVYGMIDTISKKNFDANITQVFNTKDTSKIIDHEQLSLYQEKARQILQIIQTLNDEITNSENINQALINNGEITSYAELFTSWGTGKDVFNPLKFAKDIEGTESLNQIKKVVGGLNFYKNTILEAVDAINAIAPNSINLDMLSSLDELDKRIEDSISNATASINKAKEQPPKEFIEDQEVNIETDQLLNKVKTLSEQISDDLTSLRTKIEDTFNFSTLDLNAENITSVLDNIYQQFENLQSKINSLNFSPEISGVTVNEQVDETPINNSQVVVDGLTMSQMFDGIDINQLATSFGIAEDKIEDVKSEFQELATLILNAPDKATDKWLEIVELIQKLGSVTADSDNVMQTFMDSIKSMKLKWDDSFKKELGIDIWKELTSGGNRQYLNKENGQALDEVYGDLVKDFPSLFSEDLIGAEAYQQFKVILEMIIRAREELSKGVTEIGLPENARDSILASAADIVDVMGNNAAKILSSNGISTATNAIKEEGQAAEVAAQQKLDFVEANKKVADSMKETGDGKAAAEAIEAEGVAAKEAAAKKDVFTEANKKVAESMQETNDASKIAAEGIKETEAAAQEAIDDINELDKVTTKYYQDKGIIETTEEKTVDYNTTKVTERKDEAGTTLSTTYTFIDQLKARRDAVEKEATKIKNATADLQKFLESFDNKTNNMGKYLDGYGELKGFKIENLKDIDEAITLMTKLDAEYNKVTKSFRQGTKSMNPFVNAITSIDEMENKVLETEIAFNGLNTKPDDLKNEIASLIPLLAEMQSYLAEDANGNKTIIDIYKFAKAYGELNSALRQVKSNIKIQKTFEQWGTKDANFGLDFEKQVSSLTKQQAQWEKNGQLTDELCQKINDMFDSLLEVTNSSELGIWKKQWSIVKDEVMATKYEIEAANKAQKAIGKADAAVQKKEAEDQVYWDKEFKDSLGNLIAPEKRPELEQLKAYMLQQAEYTKESVVEQYDAIMAIVVNKNNALKNLMSAKGDSERQLWQEQYSAWFGAWNSLDPDVISAFFADASNQAILGAKAINQFNEALEQSKILAARQEDKQTKEAQTTAEQTQTDFGTDVVNAYKEYTQAAIKMKKLQTDTSGKDHANEVKTTIKEIQAAIEKLSKLGIEVNDIVGNTVLTEKQTNDLLEQQIAYKKELQHIEDKVADSATSQANKEAQRYGKTIYNRENKYYETIGAYESKISDIGLSQDFTQKLQEYKNAFAELKRLREQFANNPDAFDDGKLKTEFQTATLEVERLRKEILSTFKEAQKFDQIFDSGLGIDSITLDADQMKNLKAEMIDYASVVTDGQFKLKGFNATGTEMYGVIDRGNGAVQEITVALRAGTNQLYAYESGTKQVSDSWQKLGDELQHGAKQLISMYFGFHEAIQAARSGITAVKEIDVALTELKKVTDETEQSYNRFLNTMSQSANKIGSTVKDLTTSAADWARLGYSMNEAGRLAENTAILMNVSEFDNITNATDTLVSALQAYKSEGSDVATLSMDIINKYNEVGNSFAISTSDLANSLTRSSATLVAAGNSLSESIAMTTAANATIQDPNAVGNALKVISMRIRGTTATVLEEMGEDTDGLVESTSKLQEKIKALTSITGRDGINILADDGSYKSTYQILLEISRVFDKIDDKSQAALLELLAGKQRGSVVAAILQNGQMLEDVYASAEGAEDSAMHELETYMDSIQGRIDVFNNSLQTMWMNIINRDDIKDLVDFGTEVIQFLDTIPGKITAILAAAAGILKFQGYSIFGLGEDFLKNFSNLKAVHSTLNTMSQTAPVSDDMPTTSIQAYATAVSSLTPKLQANMLVSQGLSKAQIELALRYNEVEDSVVRELTAHIRSKKTKDQLSVSTIKLSAETLKLTNTTDSLTAAEFLEANASKIAAGADVEQLMATTNLTEAQKAVVRTTIAQANGNLTLKDSFKALYAANPTMIIMSIGMAATSAVNWIKDLVAETEDLQEAYDDLQSSIQSTESEISSIKSELATTQERIDELSNKPLTIAEAKELQELQEQTAELEKQKELQETILAAREEQNQSKSLTMINNLLKTTAANQEKNAEEGAKWGKALGTVAGIIGGIAAIALTPLSGGASLGVYTAAASAGAMVGNNVGEGVGEYVGGKLKETDGSLVDWYESYTEAIEEAEKQATEAEAKYISDVNDKNYEKWQKKVDAVTTLQQEMYDGLEEMQNYVDNLEYNDQTKGIIDEYNNLMTHLSVEDMDGDITKQISSFEALKDEYKDLSKGVDANGKNIALSAEEYARYNSVIQQVLNYVPQLIQGYDAEGNAIFDRNSLLEDSIELLKEQRRQSALNATNNENILESYNTAKDNYNTQKESLGDVEPEGGFENIGGSAWRGYEIEEVIGIDFDWHNNLSKYILENSEAVFANRDKILAKAKENLSTEEYEAYMNYLDDFATQLQYVDKEMSEFKQTLYLVPQSSEYYDELSGSQLNFINSYINGLENLENLSEQEVYSIRNSILELTDIIGNNSAAQDLVDELFKIDPSDISAKQYKDSVDKIFNELSKNGIITTDQRMSIYKQLFPDMEDLNGMWQGVKQKLENGSKELVDNLSLSELKIAYRYSLEAADGSMTFEELQQKINESYSFDFANYTDSISSITETIFAHKEALEKLESGSFTMADYIELIEQFPDLAKGVDVSSKSFTGLSRNLKNAIRSSPKNLIKDLKELREKLISAGKSTVEIDQLIDSLNNMPENALDGVIDKYSTLADEIERAKTAQTELEAAMEENPNEGYETRGEAMEYMKDKMKRGEIGSESELWSVAEEYGFTYDSSKTINENADALAKFIAVREEWFATDKDGNYTFEGTEEFIKDVEKAVASSSELQKLMAWEYNEKTGAFNFDFDNKDWDQIVDLLSKSKHLAGLTYEEFADMLVQIGQYFAINWGNAQDASDHIQEIAKGSMDAATKIDLMTASVEAYIDKHLGQDLDLSTLTETTIDALDCDEAIKELLKTYLKLKTELSDPLNIQSTINEKGVDALSEIKELQGSITKDARGVTIFDVAIFEELLKEAGYTEEQIDALIAKIVEYDNVCSVSPEDPLGLNSTEVSTKSLMSSLDYLQISYQETKDKLGETTKINIQLNDLVQTLADKGWTKEQITEYIKNLTSTETGAEIQIDGKVTVTTEQIDAAIEKSKEIPEEEKTTYSVLGEGEATLLNINNEWAKVPETKETTYTIYENTIKTTEEKTKSSSGSLSDSGGGLLYGANRPRVDGTAHVSGTAYQGGSWGAPKSETALVGELGPEMRVRDGHWELIGANGAEFTDVRQGDIIFNHKQTESLLTNGYVTGRGKAYAIGTGTFNRYGFSGDGGYVKYDVNDKVVDTFGDFTDALSNAASDISDAADEFDETFDWIEVRLEEIEEKLSLFSAALENATYYTEKNSIIDSMIELNKSKIENLKAGYQEYSDYAAGLLTKIPEQYREAAQNGAIAIERFVGEADETTLEAIQNYREWAQKAADVKQQAEEVITEIRDLAIQRISNVYDAQNVRVDVENSQTEKLQNAVDYWETKGEIPSALYYGTNGGDAATSTGMFENSYKEIEYWTTALKDMQAEFNEAVARGELEVGSNEWYEQINQLYEVQSAIDQAKTEIEEFQNSINDLYWDNFDELISRFEYVESDTQNLIDLMDEADKVTKPEGKTLEGGTIKFWTADDVKWTEEGMASLGLYAQQMEIAEAKSREYAKAIDDLTADYEAGLYSENEYLEKLSQLKDGQYDAIQSYQDAKDAIVDLNKERIESVKEGINLEIEAYEELIEKKKEELNAEKDLYDFQKQSAEHSKNIADIQRRLAALATDNSASAVAKRKQLEAELAEARAEQEEFYYNRSHENQQNALSKELEDFKTEKEAEIEALDKYLENVEALVTESLGIVQANAEQIGQTLTNKAEEYNLTVSDAVMLPWKDGMLAISDYTTQFGDSVSSTTDQLDLLKAKWQEVIDKMNEAAKTDIAAKEQENKNYTAATKQEPAVKEEPKEEPKTETQTKTIAVGGKINAKGAKIYSYAGGKGYNQYYSSDPIYTVLATKGDWIQVRHHKLKSGVTGWFKKGSVQAYASGTTALKKSGLVNIDELGEELILRAENGRLSYMEKGSGIVPADLTSNLMKWGELDPTSMLENNRPTIGVHPEIHNTEINLSITYGDMVSIGEFHGDNPDDIAKIVAKQFEKHTKDLNNAIRKFVR